MILNSCCDDINVDRLKKNLSRFGMTKGWKLFAAIAVNHLGVTPDKMPLYDPSYRRKSDKILQYILNGGNFGRYAKGSSYNVIPVNGYDFNYGMKLVRIITTNFITFFPIIPFEATCICFHRIYEGACAAIKRSVKNLKH